MLIDEILTTGNKELKMIYLLIFIICVYIFSSVFELNISTIFGITVSFIIIYYLHLDTKENLNSLNNDLDYKLKKLNEILISTKKNLSYKIEGERGSIDIDSYLYMNPNMINLLYSVQKFNNPEIFTKILLSINYFLKLRTDIQKIDDANICIQNLESAHNFSRIILNYFHSFIYSLDPFYHDYHKKGMRRIHLLLSRDLLEMKKKCENNMKMENINVNTLFLNRLDYPRGIEINDTNFDVFV